MSKACLCGSCAFGPGPNEVPKSSNFDADVFCDIGDNETNAEGVERSKPGYVYAFFSANKTAEDCSVYRKHNDRMSARN